MDARRTRWLIASMALAVALVALLADWDQRRESALALDDLAEAQHALAESVAQGLALALRDARSPAELRAHFAPLEQQGQRVLLLLPPGSDRFVGAQTIELPPLREALRAGLPVLRLDRPAAALFGLPARTAMAGLAAARDPLGEQWGVAVVTTALRDRDRQQRASWRLALSTLLAAGLVAAFGGLALRGRRRELFAVRSLALEQAAREQEQRLERESRAATMITLASGMAHELGTPLGVIVGRAEQLMARAQGDERATRALRAIVAQAEEIGVLMRGFLRFARGVAPALSSVAPREVIEPALALVEHRFVEAGVTLTVRASEALPALRCEPGLLRHALVNLLLNACEACARGGAVELAAEQRGESVAFVVTDDGEGISAEAAAHATDAFFTTKGEASGSGLGLAVASEIVKTHRGTLTIAPNGGRGTRATIAIPAAAGEELHA